MSDPFESAARRLFGQEVNTAELTDEERALVWDEVTEMETDEAWED